MLSKHPQPHLTALESLMRRRGCVSSSFFRAKKIFRQRKANKTTPCLSDTLPFCKPALEHCAAQDQRQHGLGPSLPAATVGSAAWAAHLLPAVLIRCLFPTFFPIEKELSGF